MWVALQVSDNGNILIKVVVILNEKDKNHNANVYMFIREHGGWLNWSMLQVEQYEAKDKRDLETRERYWIWINIYHRGVLKSTVKNIAKEI